MTQILSQVSDAIGSILALPIVHAGFQVLGAYVVILWLGAAFWAFRDMRRRTSDILAPYGSAALVLAFTPILFPAAFLMHLVLRPPETLEERSEHELRRSILEAEAVGTTCATCASPVADDWLVCPTCAARLRRRCPTCEGLVELTWDVCAWCGRDFRPDPAVVEGETTPPLTALPAAAGVAAWTAAMGTSERRPQAPAPGSRSGLHRPAAPSRAGGPHVRRRTSRPEAVPASSASLGGATRQRTTDA